LANRIDRPLALAGFLTSLGMEPLLLHLEEYYPEDSSNAKVIIEMGHDPWICRMVNSELELPILEKLAPDLCFGQLTRNRTSIRCVKDMFGHNGTVGYSRTAGLIKSIIGILDGTDVPMRGGRGRHGAA
jgi:nitrogenase molybdenum-cofactor synthesis protein NifE